MLKRPENGKTNRKVPKIEDFSLDWLKGILNQFRGVEIIHENPLVDDYSFELVVRKAV